MYLAMIRAFAYLFLGLTCINIPLLLIYKSVLETERDIGAISLESDSLYKTYMMGNLGKMIKKCDQTFIDYNTSSAAYERLPFPEKYANDQG